jgi:hypothetical protein
VHGASPHEVSARTFCSGASTLNCYGAKYQKNGEALGQNGTEKESETASPAASDSSANPFLFSNPMDILPV